MKSKNSEYEKRIYAYDTEISEPSKYFYRLRGNILVKFICAEEVARIPQNVTVIGEWSFVSNYSENVRQIEIPNSVTTICERAIQCSNIESLVIPDSVLILGDSAFHGNTRLKTVKLSDSIHIIPHALFDYCIALEEVVIPYGVTRIEGNAFGFCKSLKRVVIPESVQYIAPYAFFHCDSLSEVVFEGRRYFSVLRSFYDDEDKRERICVINAMQAAQYLKGEYVDKIWSSNLLSMKQLTDKINKKHNNTSR